MVVVSAVSQPHVLKNALAEAGVLHGTQVVANIQMFRVGNGVPFFCNIHPITVSQVHGASDTLPFPDDVTIEGMPDLSDGFYNIKGAEISINGAVAVNLASAEFVPVSYR